ncbi:hypothetical protein TKK_0014618 [Trichogramma kaykai]|uniref:HTH CENPB-type domain-containing protein n=1 Tax=Trichogramma kaykai TaxID=54128 RepID=A0ABD2WE87_9HYME
MVRNYKRKTDRSTWTDGQMQQAIDSVLSGKSFTYSAKLYGVPRSTLQKKFLKFKNDENDNYRSYKLTIGHKLVFDPDQEQALCKYIDVMETRMMGLSWLQVRKLAYDFATKLNIPHPFNINRGCAGTDWMRSFMERHNLPLRKAEKTSEARAYGFNEKAVNAFFHLLKELMDEYNFTPDKIYNCDETGISVVPKSFSKIVAKRGRKQVGGLTAAERGETVTAEICVPAAGNYKPMMLIFPHVRHNDEFLRDAPPGAWGVFHKSGWMQTEIFSQWFAKFIEFTRASKDDPVLLLLDRHSSHTKNLKVVDMARDNGVHILCFPPHCSHRLQPLDVSFMKPLSQYCNGRRAATYFK